MSYSCSLSRLDSVNCQIRHRYKFLRWFIYQSVLLMLLAKFLHMLFTRSHLTRAQTQICSNWTDLSAFHIIHLLQTARYLSPGACQVSRLPLFVSHCPAVGVYINVTSGVQRSILTKGELHPENIKNIFIKGRISKKCSVVKWIKQLLDGKQQSEFVGRKWYLDKFKGKV